MTRRMKPQIILAGAMVSTFLSASTLAASASTFITPVGSSVPGSAGDALPVDAQAVFTTSTGNLSITLTNLESNPTAISQALSDLTFTVSQALPGISLSSSSGTQLTVNSDGTFTTGSTVDTGWSLETISPNTFELVDPAFDHSILGPPGAGGYSNADASIAGNLSTNPFLSPSASFIIMNPNITASTTITSASFSFGVTPLPGTLPLFASGLGALGLLGWRRKRKARVSLLGVA